MKANDENAMSAITVTETIAIESESGKRAK
jgi:hypothetical protein